MSGPFKILYRFYRLVSGARYRAQRRFTRAGLAVLAGLIIVGLTGLDSEISAAYQALALLFALILVAFVVNLFFRGQFSAVRVLPRFGTAGYPLRYSVLLKNLTASTQEGLTLLEDLVDPRPSFQDWMAVQFVNQRRTRSFRISPIGSPNPFKIGTFKEAPVPAMAPRQEAEVRVEFTPLRRGTLRFTGTTVARPDPLGLLRALVTMPLPQTVLILPHRYPVPSIPLPGTAKYQEGGVALTVSVGQSDEFVSLRDYRHGDPLRHIHWRTWARAGKPVVKEFEDEFFVRHALVLDTFTDDPYSEVFEEAVSVAASFACTIRTQESLLDLLFVGPQSYCLTAGRGLAHADQMLEILASVRACPDKPFRALEHLVLNHIGAVSGCICVLVAWDKARHDFVKKLQAVGVPVLVLVVVPRGQREPLDPGPMRAEPGRFHVLEAGSIEAGLMMLK